MNTEIAKIDPKEYGLEEKQAAEVQAAFMPKITERNGLAEIYGTIITQEITPELCKSAKDVRLKLVKVRTGIAEIHKTQKAFYLAAGRYVDAWKNKETAPVLQMEETLTEIEEHYSRIEAQKVAELQTARAAEIAKYSDEGAFIPGNLGELLPEVYTNYLLGVKTAYEKRIEAEETARKEEEEKIRIKALHEERKNEIINEWQFVPEQNKNDNFGLYTQSSWVAFAAFLLDEKNNYEVEQERIRKENELLKKEAAELEAKAEQERKERELKEKTEREAHEKALKAERDEKERIQRELEAKAEQERKAKEQEEIRIQAELNKGDADKVHDLKTDLEALKTRYVFKSKKYQKRYSDVGFLLEKIIKFIEL